MQTEFQKILSRDSNKKNSLNASDKNRLEDWIFTTKEDYLNAINLNQRNSIKQSLFKKASEIIDIENFKMDLAENLLDENIVGNNIEMKLGSPVVNTLSAIYTGDLPYEIENDQIVYRMPDVDPYGHRQSNGYVYKQLHEIEDYVNSKKVDLDSKDTLNTLITNASMDGANLKPGQSTSFNYGKYKSNIMNNVLPSADLDSLISDEIVGGRVFRNDLIEAIMTATYEDLGVSLSEEEIQALDPTNDGKISFADAMVIFAELMSNKERAKDYVADY